MKTFYKGDKNMTLEEQIAELQKKLEKANSDLSVANELNKKYVAQAETDKKTLEANQTKLQELKDYKFNNILSQNGIDKKYNPFVKAYLEKEKVDINDENLSKVLSDEKYKIFKNNNIIDSDNILGGENEETTPNKKELSDEEIAEIKIEI